MLFENYCIVVPCFKGIPPSLLGFQVFMYEVGVHDEALGKVMQLILKDDTQFYKLFVENESFRRELGDVVYAMTNG